MLQLHSEIVQKIFKFGLVGISGMAVDFSVTYAFKEKIGLNRYLSNSFGFSLAVLTNFFLNFCWTFDAANTNMASSFALFVGISVVGLLLNNLLIYVFTGSGINFYLAKCIAIAIVFLWNFSANYLFNFHT